MLNKALFTSNSEEWETPQELFDELDKEFHFDLDPCATPENAKCELYYTKEDDGLSRSWHWARAVYMNPPYGRSIGKWIKKAYEESQKGCTVACLLPARTDTKWFHDYCLKGEIRWIKGRIKFGGAKNSAPFPSMVVIFRFFGEPGTKINPLSREEFLKKWQGSPTFTDILKIKDYGERMRIAVNWFPGLAKFLKKFFPEEFENKDVS